MSTQEASIKMKQREFTDKLKSILGDLNWGQVCKEAKTYKKEFIIQCAYDVPSHIRRESPKNITRYLMGICKKQAKRQDYEIKQDIINMNDFKI